MNGPDDVDVEAEAPESQIDTLMEGAEHGALRQGVWHELEGAEEDLLRKSRRTAIRRDEDQRLHGSSRRNSHRRRQLTREYLGNAHSCGLRILMNHVYRWNRRSKHEV